MLYQTQNLHGGDIYEGKIVLDYSANTNPFGTPEGVLEAIRQVLDQVHQYPDPYCRQLTGAIAEQEAVPESYILCGNGAAELIYAYCRAVSPKKALEPAPTFGEYGLALDTVGCQVERYPLSGENDFALDQAFVSYLEKQRPDVVFLCNPNNPTGQLIEPTLLKRILDTCKQYGIRLFLDECFLDLTDHGVSMKSCLQEFPGLFILKAFTKSYGMAGIRLGYGLCADASLLKAMARTVQPWNVSVIAQAAGVAALKEHTFLPKTRELIVRERSFLKHELEALGFWVCPSEANYLLLHGAAGLHTELKPYGIAIRSCDNYHGLGSGWYRVAVRLHDQNKQLIQVIRQVKEKESLWQKTL